MSTGGDELAMPGMLWCSATQTRAVAEALGQPGELDGVAQRGRGSRPLADGCEVEHGQHRVGRLGARAVGTRGFSHRGLQRRVRHASSGCRARL